jgi:hypothetical protein
MKIDFEKKSLFELCEAKSCYVYNFIIYVGLYIAFDNYLGNEPHGSEAILELMAPFSTRIPCDHGQLVICIVSYTANRLTPWEHCVKVGTD